MDSFPSECVWVGLRYCFSNFSMAMKRLWLIQAQKKEFNGSLRFSEYESMAFMVGSMAGSLWSSGGNSWPHLQRERGEWDLQGAFDPPVNLSEQVLQYMSLRRLSSFKPHRILFLSIEMLISGSFCYNGLKRKELNILSCRFWKCHNILCTFSWF